MQTDRSKTLDNELASWKLKWFQRISSKNQCIATGKRFKPIKDPPWNSSCMEKTTNTRKI